MKTYNAFNNDIMEATKIDPNTVWAKQQVWDFLFSLINKEKDEDKIKKLKSLSGFFSPMRTKQSSVIDNAL